MGTRSCYTIVGYLDGAPTDLLSGPVEKAFFFAQEDGDEDPKVCGCCGSTHTSNGWGYWLADGERRTLWCTHCLTTVFKYNGGKRYSCSSVKSSSGTVTDEYGTMEVI